MRHCGRPARRPSRSADLCGHCRRVRHGLCRRLGDRRRLLASVVWGAFGERETANALNGLDDSWRCEHDIPWARGNWDHVLVGPPGVFLLDSKRLNGRAVVTGDRLASGRSSFSGGRFRAAAASLCDVLESRTGCRQWVQPVVVVWGEFPQRRLERDRVVYVHGSELLAWLGSQPGRLSADDCRELFEAVRRISDT
jgi:hypothetical protein